MLTEHHSKFRVSKAVVLPASLVKTKKVSGPSNIVYFVIKNLFLFATIQTFTKTTKSLM